MENAQQTPKRMTMLLIDFSAGEADLLSFAFQQRQIDAVSTGNVSNIVDKWSHFACDGVLINNNNPFELIQELRRVVSVPIFVLTDQVAPEADELLWLKVGATFIFSRMYTNRRLIARISALLTASPPTITDAMAMLERHQVKLLPAIRSVQCEDRDPIRLTQREFQLLHYLMRHSDQTLTNEQLIIHVWGYDHGDNGLVRNVVHHIRHKLEPTAKRSRYLHTVAGLGYRFSIE